MAPGGQGLVPGHVSRAGRGRFFRLPPLLPQPRAGRPIPPSLVLRNRRVSRNKQVPGHRSPQPRPWQPPGSGGSGNPRDRGEAGLWACPPHLLCSPRKSPRGHGGPGKPRGGAGPCTAVRGQTAPRGRGAGPQLDLGSGGRPEAGARGPAKASLTQAPGLRVLCARQFSSYLPSSARMTPPAYGGWRRSGSPLVCGVWRSGTALGRTCWRAPPHPAFSRGGSRRHLVQLELSADPRARGRDSGDLTEGCPRVCTRRLGVRAQNSLPPRGRVHTGSRVHAHTRTF